MNLTGAQRAYIDDMGQLMTGWGFPRTTGRVYAYLLLTRAPVTLDEVATDLEIAKSGASGAAKDLVAIGMARSFGEPGSRRLRFDAVYDIEAIVTARTAQTLAFFEHLRQGARVASPDVRRKILAMDAALERMFRGMPALARGAEKGKTA